MFNSRNISADFTKIPSKRFNEKSSVIFEVFPASRVAGGGTVRKVSQEQ
jgi:hypothetical protein